MKPRSVTTFAEPRAESFIHGENTLAVVSDQPFDEVLTRLLASISANGLTLVQTLDLQPLLAARGVALEERCTVLELLDPGLTAQLLAIEPGLAHLLPWRVAVHEQPGGVTVVTPSPGVLMSEFSHAAEVARLARRFETGLQRVLRGLH